MKRRDSLPTSRTKKSPASGIWSARPTFSQLRKKKRSSSSRKIASSQNEAPVSNVLAERCSPTPPRAGAFGIPTFSIFSAPVLPRFIWNFRSRKNLATDSESCPMAEFLQPDRSLRRAERRPFRPPWRNRFSLGRESFGGRSFRFTWSHDGLHGRGLLESGRAVPLINQRRVTRGVAGEERCYERERHCPFCRSDPDCAPRPIGLVVAEDSLRARSLETAPPNGRWVAL